MTTIAPETTAVATFDVAPADLDRALRIAQLAASKDQTLPILNAVALTTTPGGRLIAQATDRYILARAVVPVSEEDHRDLEALHAAPAIIPTAALAPLYAWLKPLTKLRFPNLTLNVQIIDNPHPGSSWQMVLTSPLDSTTHTVVLLDGDFPKISSLIQPWKAQDDAVDRVSVAPDKLEKITKMGKLGCERNTAMEMVLGSAYNKPVRFRGRDGDGEITFEALVMPVSGGFVSERMGQDGEL